MRTCIYYYYFDHILVRISNVSKCTTIFTICCVSVAGGTKPTFGLRVKKKKKKKHFTYQEPKQLELHTFVVIITLQI